MPSWANLNIAPHPYGRQVWPVTETVMNGFTPMDAPLDMRGTHFPPAQFHEAMANPNSIMIDAWNFNEALIGKFAPPPSEERTKKVGRQRKVSGG
eukprot:gene8271-1540_t